MVTSHDGFDRCDCKFAFQLSSGSENERRLIDWTLAGAELVDRTTEGQLMHRREAHDAGYYFLVATEFRAICFCVRYAKIALPAGVDVVEIACWQSLLFGDSHRAKQTVMFDELLYRFEIVCSRTDLIIGASRFWFYNMAQARARGLQGGVIFEGERSYYPATEPSLWTRQHGLVAEGSLPREGCRFFLQR